MHETIPVLGTNADSKMFLLLDDHFATDSGLRPVHAHILDLYAARIMHALNHAFPCLIAESESGQFTCNRCVTHGYVQHTQR